MKVLIGYFVTESNANVRELTEVNDYDIAFGEDCLRKSHVADVFEKEGIEVIPSIYASAGAASVISQEAFSYIEGKFLRAVHEHLDEIDGIWLMLHGAGCVENGGSADHHILKEIRKITGNYLPVAVCCDPHGNLSEEYVRMTTILRSYRESPHTDSVETMRLTASMLCTLLKQRENIHSIYRRLPLLFEGEQSVSYDEPVRSINQFMNELEKDERIRSCSWHVGYIRQDADYVGAGIVVVPQKEEDIPYAEQTADRLYEYIWQRRQEFHYTDPAVSQEEAVRAALKAEEKPFFVTDSGDNVTAGAPGKNTTLLRLFSAEQTKKRILFANICDPAAFRFLNSLPAGTETEVTIGTGEDELSTPLKAVVVVMAKGELRGYMSHDHNHVSGHSVLVHLKDTCIDVNVADYRTVMCEHHQFIAGNIDWDDYDVIVVKMGYIFPELREKASGHVMALTEGATNQDIPSIHYRRIFRPVFPIDRI